MSDGAAGVTTTTAIALAVVSASAIVLFVLQLRKGKNKRKSNVEGKAVPLVPGAIPFLGHGAAFGANPHAFFHECKEKYGCPFEIDLVGKRSIVIDGSLRKEFFTAPDTFLNFTKSVLETIVPELTVGVESVTNAWHTPIIRKQFASSLMHRFNGRLARSIIKAIDNDLPNCTKIGDRSTMPSIEPIAWSCVAACSASSFFGTKLGSERAILDVFISFHTNCFKVINMNSLVPRFILNLIASSVQKDKDTIKSFIVPEVIRRRKLLADNANGTTNTSTASDKAIATDDSGEVDLLQYMLDVADTATGEVVSPDCIAERAMTLIFSSMVTTAGVLNHVLCDLAGRGDDLMPACSASPPDAKRTVWECLHAEQVAALRAADGLNEQALEKLPLLTAFILESMRMGSMTVQQSRLCIKDGLLGGYVIEEGTLVFISGELAHKDPTTFPDPQVFKPLRFLDLTQGGGASDPASSESMGLFPFGIGRHVCVGRNFAMAELKMTIVVLMQRYRFRTTSGKVPAYRGEPSFCERFPEEVVFERVQSEFALV